MIVSHDQKLLIILAHNNTGTAARNLYGLARSEPGLLLHDHSVIDGNNRWHCLFNDGGNIGLDCGSNRCTGGRAAAVI